MRLVTEEDAVKARKKVKALALTYGGITVPFVAAALLLLFLSPEKYIPFLILDVLLTAAFGVYSVYFFTVSFYLARKKCAWLERVLSARSETQFAVYQAEDGVKTIDGLAFYTYIFVVKGDEREYKTFEPFVFAEGQKYRIESGASVVLSSEQENG